MISYNNYYFLCKYKMMFWMMLEMLFVRKWCNGLNLEDKKLLVCENNVWFKKTPDQFGLLQKGLLS